VETLLVGAFWGPILKGGGAPLLFAGGGNTPSEKKSGVFKNPPFLKKSRAFLCRKNFWRRRRPTVEKICKKISPYMGENFSGGPHRALGGGALPKKRGARGVLSHRGGGSPPPPYTQGFCVTRGDGII